MNSMFNNTFFPGILIIIKYVLFESHFFCKGFGKSPLTDGQLTKTSTKSSSSKIKLETLSQVIQIIHSNQNICTSNSIYDHFTLYSDTPVIQILVNIVHITNLPFYC